MLQPCAHGLTYFHNIIGAIMVRIWLAKLVMLFSVSLRYANENRVSSATKLLFYNLVLTDHIYIKS